ncbi:Hsp20 family protein [Natronomonas sp. CBA1123]|uniref:Hsp20/alpha crystallin family protein n=1 Tax=Natronomonas sp. CBA1123 TaxID=2668070 RepID=UPI0012E9FC7F|nr:Hsp20/alpha crystallin family protein [Natronomonas sp. CBA1123]MUV88053.1 Hsp20 family protein [Natronomonas sp. CBA1123]
MIREVGESLGRAVLDGIGRASSRVQERKPLAADVLESDDAVLVVFDAPSATADDVDVSFENNTITVRLDRFREFHDGYEMRFPGRGLGLKGSAELPEDASVEAADAEATVTQKGTLEVRIPKAADDSEPDADETDSEDIDATAGA